MLQQRKVWKFCGSILVWVVKQIPYKTITLKQVKKRNKNQIHAMGGCTAFWKVIVNYQKRLLLTPTNSKKL